MKTPRVPIAKEGYPFIYASSFVTLVLAIIAPVWLTIIGLILSLFVISFFRDPERFTPPAAEAIVSPADGKVLHVEKIHDETYLHQDVLKVSIFMNLFNVHVNRNPFTGTVGQVIHTPGKFYSADKDRAALLNERCATILHTETGEQIAYVQIAGLVARRIVNWLEPGDLVRKGDRMGLIRFGSRLDVYLPADTEILVNAGDRVNAGESIIARFPEVAAEAVDF